MGLFLTTVCLALKNVPGTGQEVLFLSGRDHQRALFVRQRWTGSIVLCSPWCSLVRCERQAAPPAAPSRARTAPCSSSPCQMQKFFCLFVFTACLTPLGAARSSMVLSALRQVLREPCCDILQHPGCWEQETGSLTCHQKTGVSPTHKHNLKPLVVVGNARTSVCAFSSDFYQYCHISSLMLITSVQHQLAFAYTVYLTFYFILFF